MDKWASIDGLSPEALKTMLPDFDKYKVAESFEDLTTKSERPEKLFWNLVDVFFVTQEPPSSATQKKEEKRVRLRAEMLSLCETFQKHRNHLNSSSNTFMQIKQALEAVAGNALQAYQKGYLGQADLEDVRKELNVIDKELVHAEKKQ